MNTATFWEMIASCHRRSGGDCEEQAKLLRKQLLRLPADEILAFNRIFDRQRERAYTWRLWGAADLINGSCSDDGFEYFRWWLIAQGKAVFERALRNPDTLAGYLEGAEGVVQCEAIGYAVVEAYEEKTGTDFPTPQPREWPPPAPRGERWAEEDLPALLPKLAAKFK